MLKLSNLKGALINFPEILRVTKLLNQNNITYGIFGSFITHLVSNERVCSDIDIKVLDEDFKKLTIIFPQSEIFNDSLGGRFVPEEFPKIEILNGGYFSVAGNSWHFDFSPLSVDNRVRIEVDSNTFWIMNPVDTLLLKCFLQRDRDCGKSDIEDAKKIINGYELDKEYLRKRLNEMEIPNHRISICLNSLSCSY